ncbi:tRNA (N6-isopentenyl adenosine(37)-C2)-methylthiotransferase MiaB [Opitutales bacterium ASA1]|uniref:tRNA (N6-isopentenyl adenosine(37)-C2)-methylthiotransferase MiaB n=1 Tax=Congregicoccus parvus TaxID=3081749 RepID=UPI002B287880|nr:tRNA (N6-isopentenyl adenosine(37)-C2)-methylthiotransferase MiaB [Opitutales bacterium ASA1]
MNRVYIKTYGCQMNERDSEAVAAMLRHRGYAIVDTEHAADVVLVNTCSVRDQAEQKAIGKMGYLAARKRKNPDLVLGVMGCMAQNRGADLLDRLPDLDLLVGTQKFHQVPDHLDNIVATLRGQGPRPSTVVDLAEEAGSQNAIRDHLPASTGGKRQVSAFVSIMQGCNMACTFCIVPKTRGEERSRPIDDIVAEVEALAADGVREVTLLGQIVTSYGRREFPFREGRSPFVQLLERVHEIPGIARIRFTSPHPRGFKDDLVQAFRDLPKLCPCVHLPLQSGSDRILRAMNRPYTREAYAAIIDKLRAAVPDMYFSTDIIVGFPGETDEDFGHTVDMFERVRFDMAFVFKYSIRTGTPAADIPDQLPADVKEARNDALLELLRRYSLARNEALVGTVQHVLVEGPDKLGRRLSGKTPGGRLVHVPGDDDLVGEIVPVRIRHASASAMIGDLAEQPISVETVPGNPR